MPIPRFQYTLASLSNSKNGYITLGDEKVHRINDAREFYRALGYTDEILESGLLPEEYIWFEYHKDKSEKSEVCLQVKIIEYLSKHSAAFKEKYAAQCEYWLARCVEKWMSNSAQCKDCETPKAIIGLTKAS